MLGYNLEPSVYFILNQQIGYRVEVENIDTVYYTGLYQMLFYIIFSLLLKYPVQNKCSKIVIIGIRKSPPIFYLCCIIFLFCIIKGKSGQTIFQSGGYSDTMKNIEVSSLYGYGIIVMGVAVIYANTKRKLQLLYVLSIIYVLKDFAFGGRIDSIMLGLLWFVVYIQYILKKSTILILVFIAFIFNSIFEVYRLATSGNIIQLLSSNSSIISVTTGNSAEVFYASMRIIYMIQESILTFGDRMLSAFYFILSIIIPYDKLPDIANLSQYESRTYWTGGGGLCSTFSYAMFGLIGVAILGYFISRQFNYLMQNRHKTIPLFYAILIVVTTPRWFAYYPIAIIKYCVYGAIFLSIIFSLDQVLTVIYRSKTVVKVNQS